MLRTYFLILICLFLSLGSQVEAEDAHPAPQARAPSTPSSQDLESIFAMADQGDAGSQNYLGFLYATGQTVAKDEKAAFGWFQKAASQGHPEALGNLAMMYEKGLGATKNMRTAFDLHRQAAMAGYPFSMKRLASLYETGFMGEESDPINAEMWKTRYKETLKSNAPAAGDATPQRAAGKAKGTAPVEKSTALKLPLSSINLPPEAATSPALASTQIKPVLSSSSSKTSAVVMPYFIQIGGKATAREAMEVTQKIVENNLLPQNKKIELINPDGKNYRLNIGPFADAHQAAPYKAKIMALLNADHARPTATPPPASSSPTASVRPAEKASAAAQVDKSATKQPKTVIMTAVTSPLPVGTPSKSAPPLSTAQTESSDKGKSHYIEVSGQATVQEATELMQNIVNKGMLPKNMQVEIINLDADNYRIRIGPFSDASGAAPEIAKINASIKNVLLPPDTLKISNQPPVASAQKQSVPAATITLAPIEPPLSVAKIARGHYYFIQIDKKNTFEDSMILAKFLLVKGLVKETRRLKIENLDEKNFRVSIGPFSDAEGARRQLHEINQKSLQALSVKLIIVSGDGVHRPFIQINTQGTLDNAEALTNKLMEKGFLPSNMFVEIVNFGADNYRVRFGPFNETKDADQNIRNLSKQLKVSPILVNLEPLLPVNEK